MRNSLLASFLLVSAISISAVAAYSQVQNWPCNNCVAYGPPIANGSPKATGWIVGEIRAFAFGNDSPTLIDQLATLGWVECRGQSLSVTSFPELWNVIGPTWGTADRTNAPPFVNTFFLPDLRGMFLRGWDHGRQPYDPVNHNTPPFTGDRENRIQPRPEALPNGIAGSVDKVVNGTFVQDHVGSIQADQVGPHRHWVANGYQKSNTDGNGTLEYTQNGGFPPTHYTDEQHPDGSVAKETHPSNAYVTFMIYVGRPAKSIEVKAEGATSSERVQPR